jgi:protease IV
LDVAQPGPQNQKSIRVTEPAALAYLSRQQAQDWMQDMTASADQVLDRRRLRRKLGFWRIAALFLAAAAALGTFLAAGGGFGGGTGKDHIAKVRITGPITEDEELIGRLGDIEKSDKAKGLIVMIDSPGGTTAGGEAIYEAIRKIAAKKPVAAQIGTLGASAGYMIAVAADHVVARQSSIVGSIGVIFQYPDISELLGKVGVKVESIKSSPMKAEPNFFNPASEQAKTMIRKMILDSYDWFVGIVDERRPFDRTQTLALADGSVFTGRQALQNKLIDELGGEAEALKWLSGKGLDEKLEVIEWKRPESGVSGLLPGMSARLMEKAFGIPAGSGAELREGLEKHMFLDGLLSLWHVDLNAAAGK